MEYRNLCEIVSGYCRWPDGNLLPVPVETQPRDPTHKQLFAVYYNTAFCGYHSSIMSEEYNSTWQHKKNTDRKPQIGPGIHRNGLLMLELYLHDLHRKLGYCEEIGECAYLHFGNLVTNTGFHPAGVKSEKYSRGSGRNLTMLAYSHSTASYHKAENEREWVSILQKL